MTACHRCHAQCLAERLAELPRGWSYCHPPLRLPPDAVLCPDCVTHVRRAAEPVAPESP